MKIAIVDDRNADAVLISELILDYMREHGISCEVPRLFASGEEFLASFSPSAYDIIFLDIYMEGITGMDTARRIRQRDISCGIVFVTTSPDFAVESYDVAASYYLIKPVTKERIALVLERCGVHLAEQKRYILVPSQGTEIQIFLHSIAYTEFAKRKILVHGKDGSCTEVSMSQKEFAQLLQPYDWFCDCIKGILVNFEDVYKLMDDRFLMKCGASIPISRLKYHEVREKYLNYTYRVLRKG